MTDTRPTTSPWRPIAEAAKGPTSILVWCAERRNTYVVTWVDCFDGTEGWQHFGGGGFWLTETPTHWMPIPPPPKESEQ